MEEEAAQFGPEVGPNWDRMRSLFLPGARMILLPRRDAASPYAALDVAAFQDRVRGLLTSWNPIPPEHGAR